MKPRRFAQICLTVLPGFVLMGLLVWISGRNPYGPRRFTLFDDAMISMTYGRTLASTGELVWFPGAPRVQGFTNPLWTLYMSLLHALGLGGSSASLAVMLTGIVVITATSVSVMFLVENVTGRRLSTPAMVAGGLVPFVFPLTFWTLRGMEVGLLSLCAIVGVRASLLAPSRSTRLITSCATCLGVLTRLDFVLMPVAVSLFLLCLDRRGTRARSHLLQPVVGAVSACAVVTFQRIYWGSWLPNTYALKLGGVGLADRLERGLMAGGKTLATTIIALAVISWSWRSSAERNARSLAGACASTYLAFAAYSVWVGGDAWEDMTINRFVAVPLPLILVAVAVVLVSTDAWFTARRTVLWGALVVSAGCAALGVNPFSVRPLLAVLPCLVLVSAGAIGVVSRRVAPSLGSTVSTVVLLVALTAHWGANGAAKQIMSRDILRTHTNHWVTESAIAMDSLLDDKATVATVWAGVPAYYTNQPMIDLLGKSDVHVASVDPRGSFWPGHNKWDYGYSIGQLKPDVVFQLWTRGLEPDIDTQMRTWGYVRKCTESGALAIHGIWFRVGSTHIRWAATTACPD